MQAHPRVNSFRPVDAESFQESSPHFGDFVTWNQGRLWQLINSEPVYRQMAAFSLRGLPAVASITHLLAPILAPIDELAETDPEAGKTADRARRAIGSMVRAVLEANGFRKTGTQRAVPPEPRRLFVRAEVYEQAPPAPPEEGESFDWDKYAVQASFANVRSLSPDLGGRPLPSMYSPDRRWFLLSSLDIDVPTASEDQLRIALDAVKRSYQAERSKPTLNYRRLWVHQIDFYELCNLLFGLVSDADEFADPQELLES